MEETKALSAEVVDTTVAVNNDDVTRTIVTVANSAVTYLQEDRARANETFETFRDLLENGASSPDDKRELNAAQENAQKVTANTINLISALVRLRQGETKVQIANVNAPGTGRLDKEKIIELIEQTNEALKHTGSES